MPGFRQDKVELNLTPMIDVVLLLLCFFVITSNFTTDSENQTTLESDEAKVLDVNLPSSSSKETISDKATIVALTNSGLVTINQLEIPLSNTSQIAEQLTVLGGQQNDFVIQADANTPHQLVVQLMDIASNEGYNKIRIATRP